MEKTVGIKTYLECLAVANDGLQRFYNQPDEKRRLILEGAIVELGENLKKLDEFPGVSAEHIKLTIVGMKELLSSDAETMEQLIKDELNEQKKKEVVHILQMVTGPNIYGED